MAHISSIAKSIGSRALAERLGVGETAVFNAIAKGSFPAKWYLVVSEMCADRGVECPAELFSFSTPPASEDAA